jgi:hypothetical protein
MTATMQKILPPCAMTMAMLLAAPALARQTGEDFISSEKDNVITVLNGKTRQVASLVHVIDLAGGRIVKKLRQPVFLAHGGSGGGIAGVASFDGFLHPSNNLDTLGADEKDSPCKLRDSATGGSK